MRAAIAAIVVLAAACGSSPPPAAGRAPGASCRADAECDGFCDRDRCAAVDTPSRHGTTCTAPSGSAAIGPDTAKLYTCGAYLCVDARCRSCTSDDECRSTLGAPRCVPVEALPGRRCGA